MTKFFWYLLVFMLCLNVIALAGEQIYVPEKDPDVQAKLDQWQDLKFGLLMHWGSYSQWGIVESWSICSEDEPWCQRKMDNYEEYKRAYVKLKETFNPMKFAPEKWATAAKKAGMKYLVFTTKHHDGFCMFDTQYTDYKITDPGCTFNSNPRANVTKEIFDAFRKEGLWTGAYFSKPDWHSENYWWPYFATPDRNVNYDIKKYPDRWENFINYTHGQIDELMSHYGKVDILWLDGGWVAARNRNQDIRMAELVKNARQKQSGLIVVDRAVSGPFQNYLTPENHVPDDLLPYPWESCIIAGGGWSWVPNARYKSPGDVIHMLVDIVSKGGNLLLNIAPGPDGTWDDQAYDLLDQVGKWMAINSEAIYNSRPLSPYKEDRVCLTQQKDGAVYAIYLAEKDQKHLPSRITLSTLKPAKDAQVTMLGLTGQLKWERKGQEFVVHIPDSVQTQPPGLFAWTIKISDLEQ